MKKKLEQYSRLLDNNDWQTQLKAADDLAKIGTTDSFNILVDKLKSDNNFVRNAAALGLMKTKCQQCFSTLLNRIIELGPDKEIGTLVYALSHFDCSGNILEITNLYLKGNYEVKSATTNVLNNQTFKMTKADFNKFEKLLKENGYSLDTFDVKYELVK